MNNNSSRAIRLTTLAGVQNAEIQGDVIVGRWRPDLGLIASQSGASSIVERFVNSKGTAKDILRFTLRYGPLSKPDPGAEFRQSFKDWRGDQEWLQRLWSFGRSLGYKIGMQSGELVRFDSNGRVSEIEVASLRRLLEFEICSTPHTLRRKCARPECRSYFIADRIDNRVCNLAACGKWAQREFKRKWWSEHGEKWRTDRAKETKHRAGA
jgi:hypothetical protein